MTQNLQIYIDLNAILRNYQYLQSISKAKISAVVKANAYGLGAAVVSRALEDAGCKIFFVARLEEGVELRLSGIRSDIYVLHGIFAGEEKEFVQYHLMPVLNSFQQASLWNVHAASCSQQLQCMIHIDTGMNRLGMSCMEAIATQDLSGLNISYVISHLACSDELGHIRNAWQLEKFQSYQYLFPMAQRSLVSSSGIFLKSAYHFDLLRPGKALYGLNPIPYKTNPMLNALSLFAKIIQIREIIEDDFVGYNSTYKVTVGTKIATIPLGYSDGYLRHLSNRGFAVIRGVKVPVIGRISMDLVTLDVTDLDCALGDLVEIIGPNCPADEIAQYARTTGYEILTSLSRLAQRTYAKSPNFPDTRIIQATKR